MDKEFIVPNFHVVLVHYPIALLVCGTLIELFSFMWRRHSFRAAGRWMILLGALSGIPTVFSGLYALHDVANPSQDMITWKDVVAQNTLNDKQWHLLTDHLWQGSLSTLLAVVAVITWIGCSDTWRSRLHLPLLAMLVASCALAGAAAWHAGEAIFRHGVAIETHVESPTTTTTVATTSATAPTELIKRVEAYAPPIQVHAILAGAAVAMALVSLGLSLRRASQTPMPTEVDSIAEALGPPSTLLGAESSERRPDPPDRHFTYVPASRFWMLASLLAVLTAAAGWWTLASASDMWVFRDLWQLVRDSQRRLAHLIAGGAMIVLPIVLALLARWAPRQKILLAIVSLLLIAAVAAQVWFGVLLMFDTSEGILTRFQ